MHPRPRVRIFLTLTEKDCIICLKVEVRAMLARCGEFRLARQTVTQKEASGMSVLVMEKPRNPSVLMQAQNKNNEVEDFIEFQIYGKMCYY